MQTDRIHVMIKVNEKIKQAADRADSEVLSPHQSVRAAMGQRDDDEKGQEGQQIDRSIDKETGKWKQGYTEKGTAGERVYVRQPWREEGGASHPLSEPLLWGRHLFP